MSPRTGRPKIENPKNERITIRLDDDTLKKLNAYCSKEKIDKAEAVRRGIDKITSELK